MTVEKQLLDIWDNMAVARLFRTFRLALAPSRMLIALFAIIFICISGWILDKATMSVVVVSEDNAEGNAGRLLSELDVFISDSDSIQSFIDSNKDISGRTGLFSTLWKFTGARFNQATVSLLQPDMSNIFDSIRNIFINIKLCMLSLVWAAKYHFLYCVIFFSIILISGCFSAGAICRSAALEYGRGEKPGLLEVLSFSREKFKHLIAAPLIPLGIMVFFGFFVYALGLLSNIPGLGEILLAAGFPLALIFGCVTTLMIIGTIAGGNLMFPVLAYEGTDGNDAVSRSLRYVFSQPWWMLFYTTAAALYGTVSYLFVRIFAYLILIITYIIVDMGMSNSSGESNKLSRIWSMPTFLHLKGPDVSPETWSEAVSAYFIKASVLFITALVAAYVISYCFCAGTVIYSLLRRKIDGVSIDRIYLKLDEVFTSVDAPRAGSTSEDLS